MLIYVNLILARFLEKPYSTNGRAMTTSFFLKPLKQTCQPIHTGRCFYAQYFFMYQLYNEFEKIRA